MSETLRLSETPQAADSAEFTAALERARRMMPDAPEDQLRRFVGSSIDMSPAIESKIDGYTEGAQWLRDRGDEEGAQANEAEVDALKDKLAGRERPITGYTDEEIEAMKTRHQADSARMR